MGTIANDYIVDLGLVAVLLKETFGSVIDKLAVEIVAYQINSATAETATHDA